MENVLGYRLSPQQEHLWTLLAAGSDQPYAVQASVAIRGDLDRGRLRAALAAAVRRHSVLRTAFRRVEGIALPLQAVAEPQISPLWEPDRDFQDLDPAARQAGTDAALAALTALGFDLENGGVLRALLIDLEPGSHRLLLSASALCADGRSLGNLVRETAAAYDESGEGEPEEEDDYVMFSEWLNDLLEAEEAQVGRDFWRSRGSAAGAAVSLPGEPAAEGREGRMESVRFDLPRGSVVTAGGIDGGGGDTSPGAMLLSAWAALLHRLTGRDEIAVGVLCGGRSDEDLQRAVGPFARHLPFASSLDLRLPLRRAAAEAEEKVREMEEWQECFSWEDMEGFSSFSFGFAMEEEPPVCRAGSLELAVVRCGATLDRFTVALSVAPRGEAFAAELRYDASRLTEVAAVRLARQLAGLLADAASRPSAPVEELEILSEPERRLLQDLNRTERPWSVPQCLHRIVEEQAKRTPDAIAVGIDDAGAGDTGGEQLTYGELNARANRLARRLRRIGVGPESRVGVLLERSAEMVIALLGALKAGAAYVPLDPTLPKDRLALIAQDAGVEAILTVTAWVESVPPTTARIVRVDAPGDAAADGTGDLGGGATPDHLAYILYTSGSTGRPKGVMIPHRSICNRILWMIDAFPFAPSDVVLQKTAFSFDASIWELFLPLMIGARLVMARPGGHQDPAYLVDAVRRHDVTVLQLVPSMLRIVLDEPAFAGCRSLRLLFCGGEALPAQLGDRVFDSLGLQLHNLYGPTEVSIDATSWTYCHGAQETTAIMPIGRPISNMQVHVLGRGLGLSPLGVPGELYVSGVGLARGYLNRPELTAERFVPSHLSSERGERLYRTGDLARLREDGAIEYLGRADHQVKVRGFRIELGEIEAVLARHPGVREAVVAIQDGPGGARLAAYVVPTRRAARSAEGLYRLPNGLEVHHLNRGETDWLYSEIFEDRAYERHGITLADGDCVIDAGANIGLFTLFVGTSYPRARIFSFEPAPPTFDTLRRNVEHHGLGAQVFQCALSDRTGEAVFTFYPQVSASSGLYPDAEEDERVTRAYLRNQDAALGGYADELMEGRFESRQFRCPLTTISDFLREQGIERVDLLKLDVEKSELDVLAGVRAEDWPRIRQIVIEVHEVDGRLDRIRGLLEPRGFVVEVEEAEALQGSGLYNLYARRPEAADAPRAARTEEGTAASAPAGAEALSTTGLRRYLGRQLPDYMVPSAIVLLDELPRTASGKVDRQALPSAETEGDEGEASAAPRNLVEQMVAGILAEVLGRPSLGLQDNFFDLGGHSLLATRAVGQLRRAFGLEIPLRILFDTPRVAELAAWIEGTMRERSAAPPPIVALRRDGRAFPLSFSQQRLWFFDRLMPGSSVYNVPAVLRLTGSLNLPALERTFDALVERHEPLRTTFREADGEAVQVIGPAWRVPLAQLDLAALPYEVREAELRRLVHLWVDRPFDLQHGPLLRVAVLRLGAQEHVLAMAMHHILADGWSMTVLIRDMYALYEAYGAGRVPGLSALPVQYADFADWQRRWLQGDVLAGLVDFWKRELGDRFPQLELPADRPRSASPTYRGAKKRVQVDAPLAAELRALSRRQGVTMFMTLLAALEVLLHRYSGQELLFLGTNVAARDRGEIQPLIGFFLNVLVLRADLSGNPTFGQLLERVRETTLSAYSHQDLPFDKLVETLLAGRDRNRSSLFQVKIDYQNVPAEILTLPGLVLTPFELEEGPVHSEMTLSVFDSGPDLQLTFEYNRDLFDEARIERLVESYVALLAQVVNRPDSDLRSLVESLEEADRSRTILQGREIKEQSRRGLKDIRRKAVVAGGGESEEGATA